MARPSFDDITPPARGNDTETPSTAPHAQDDTPTAEESSATSEPASIRNVAAPETKARVERRARRAERRTLGGSDGPTGRSHKGMTRMAMWGGAIVVLLIALTGVGFLFIGKTTLTVEPLSERITLGENVVHTAYTEPEIGELGYTVVSATQEASETITATGSEYVEERASGRIAVYNNYSSASQRLIKNTRFEAPDGRIYRVTNSFVVPGMPDEDTAGRIEVTVHADVPGSDQNLTALGTRLTIPGLEGDPRYNAFHAELITPITGGFEGERPVVDEATREATRTALQDQLRRQAADAAHAAAGDLYVFDTALQVQFESLPMTTDTEGNATVRERALISAVGFTMHELARTLAQSALATPADGTIRIANPNELTFRFVGDDVSVANDALIQFTLSGTSVLVWDIDVDALKQDLVGKHSTVLNSVMSGYPGIESAQATIRPFWKSEFPSDTDNISVEITDPVQSQ